MNIRQHCHTGGCDCGAIQIEYHCSQSLAELVARACQCSFCAPQATSYLSEPNALLRIRLKDSRYLYAHCFGTRTADFMHCVICNALVFVKSNIDEHEYALVVARTLRESPMDSPATLVAYDTETLAQRLQRRAHRWIATLEVCTDAS